MAGPKYVRDFSFPKDFGFSGSAGQTHVKPHMRFAKGGRVRKPLKPSPGQVVGALTGAAAAAAAYKKLKEEQEREPQPPVKESEEFSTVDAARGTIRRKREQELGLKKGGRARR